jgi:hypothetical protein
MKNLIGSSLILLAALAFLFTRTDGADQPKPEHGRKDNKPAGINRDIVMQIVESKMSDEDKLAALHCLQSQYPETFCWDLHNWLRHLYAGRNERASMGQCDIILKNSTDDDYMLNILSDWKLEKDNVAAVKALEAKAKRYPDLRHVAATCYKKARNLRRGFGNPEATPVENPSSNSLGENEKSS